MNCRKAEILVSRSLDETLSPDQAEALALHLDGCARCRAVKAEYEILMTSFSRMARAESKPYFVRRVEAGIKGKTFVNPFLAWRQWGIRAVSFSMLLISLVLGAIYFSRPAPSATQELSRSEVLLLRELNPFQETLNLFEAESAEKKNMMLIFSSLEETDIRRYFP